tara:strand:+ start:149 stop:253 length:105 start_codon:yes stop_codon:yes gene_type:complete
MNKKGLGAFGALTFLRNKCDVIGFCKSFFFEVDE